MSHLLRLDRRLARPLPLALAAIALALVPPPAVGEVWPQWRGPRGDSVSDETGLPLHWSEDAGVAWKTPLPAWGTSTPAVWGDAIFVTTQQDDRLLLLRLGGRAGEIAWTREVGQGTPRREGGRREQKFHQLHNMASPSPVTDGELVVAHFGNGDLAAYDFEGNLLWQRNLERDYGAYTIWWGHANSPVLYEDLVISVCMQDSLAGATAEETGGVVPAADRLSPSYLVAHDQRTGEERWKSMRMTGAAAEECDSYTTPLLYREADRWRLLVMGGNQLDAYDPATGRQVWFLPGIVGGRTITGPTVGNGLAYATQGMRGPLLAVRLEGEGEVPRRSIAWWHDQGTPDSCCPVLWHELLFLVGDNGVARCFDALTGHLQWSERLAGEYKASPLAADGRIYFLNTEGLCTVVAASDRFDVLAENQLDDEMLASPAVSDGRLYLRGRKHLYCVFGR